MKRPARLGLGRILGMILGAVLMASPLACSGRGATTKAPTPGRADAPAVSEIVPRSGSAAGGAYLLVIGQRFQEESRVYFGNEEAYEVTYVSPTELKVLAPMGKTGAVVDLVVEVGSEDDPARGVLEEAFRYHGLSGKTVALLGLFIFLLALLGLPLFLVIGAGTILGYVLTSQEEALGFFSGVSEAGRSQPGLGATIFNWVTDMGGKPLFIAIPLFTFAGSLMSESGAPTRLVNVARALVGWAPGGLAWVTLIVCCFFTAFTGASGVTIIALGGLLFPILLREGYSENYSLGLLTTGGSLGLLIPPSLPVIVYGIIAGLDTDRIWDAGLLPMVLIIAILGIHAIVQARRGGVPRHKTSVGEIGRSLRAALWELPLPVIVVWGIKGGYVTATEAAAVTAFWVLIVEVFIYKDISLKQLPGVIRRSMILVGGLIIIIGLALAFTTYLTKNEVPQRILAVMQARISSQLAFLLMLNVFLLIVGCLMDIFSAILVVVPLIAPVAIGFGVDPYHLAIVFLVNLEIGYSTPPVGINLFISSMRFRRPVFQMYRASVVFIALLLVGLIVLTYMPWISIGRFELPEASIIDGKGAIRESLSITAGQEGVLKVSARLGGVDLESAKAAETRALDALRAQEKSSGLDFDALTAAIAAAESRIVNAEGSEDAREKDRRTILEVKGKLAALKDEAAAYEEARQRRLAIDNLRKTAVWRCRNHPDFEENGAEIDLSEVEAGAHIIALTVANDKKHIAQVSMELTVKPGADEDDEDE